MVSYQHLDSDEHRLPEGMRRGGYDADTQTYAFRDSDGSHWESNEGDEYGELHRAGTAGRGVAPGELSRQRGEFWKYFAPWMLIVVVALLLFVRFLNARPAPLQCAAGEESYVVRSGDTCWEIAHAKGISVDQLVKLNPQVNCNALRPSDQLCLPEGTAT